MTSHHFLLDNIKRLRSAWNKAVMLDTPKGLDQHMSTSHGIIITRGLYYKTSKCM